MRFDRDSDSLAVIARGHVWLSDQDRISQSDKSRIYCQRGVTVRPFISHAREKADLFSQGAGR